MTHDTEQPLGTAAVAMNQHRMNTECDPVRGIPESVRKWGDYLAYSQQRQLDVRSAW